MNKLTKAFLLLAAVALFPIQSAPVLAQTYIGEFCWIADDGEEGDGDDGNTYLQLAIQLVGDDHFSVVGKAFEDESLGDPSLLHGNAEIVGSQVLFNVNVIHADQEGATEFLVASNILARVSLVNLNGSFRGVEMVTNGSNFVESGAIAGTLTFTPCP